MPDPISPCVFARMCPLAQVAAVSAAFDYVLKVEGAGGKGEL